MAQKKQPGAPRKYKSARTLEKAVQNYWKSISFEKPVIISTPTGEVDERGNVKFVTKMLTMGEDGRVRVDGLGKPRTVVEYIEEPSAAGLCLFLGISKDTWARYAESEDLGPICAKFKLRMESHLLSKLDGNSVKNVQGVIFNLKNNYGYQDRCEVENKGDVAMKIEFEGDVGVIAE